MNIAYKVNQIDKVITNGEFTSYKVLYTIIFDELTPDDRKQLRIRTTKDNPNYDVEASKLAQEKARAEDKPQYLSEDEEVNPQRIPCDESDTYEEIIIDEHIPPVENPDDYIVERGEKHIKEFLSRIVAVEKENVDSKAFEVARPLAVDISVDFKKIGMV